ncbi:MAG: DNA polymerase III subunit beta, partial [Candidatus Cloacimonetes bacterium]|nr:DNA polymerase III subunit beta [Candidatus Cloacimonadota bacterium]
KRLLDIVRELDDSILSLASDKNNQVELRSGASHFHLPSESPESFPVLPEIAVQSEIEMAGERLKDHIERLGFAVSADELRPVLTGVLFEFQAESLNLVATDGHRLVRIRDTTYSGQGAIGSVVVPVKALNLVARSITSNDEVLLFGMARNHLAFRLKDSVIYSRLIEGNYPAYEGVIPQDNSNILQANRAAVSRMIKQVAHCANSITRQITLGLSENRLVASAEDNEVGSRAHTELDVDYNGDALEIAFNATYLEQLLKHVPTEDVVIKFGTQDKAALVLPELNRENEDYLMLLMPVRLMR